MSMTGGPNALIGATAFSPSASEPQCTGMIPTSFAPDPSGAVSSPATSMSSSGAEAHVSRKNCSTSRPFWSGCAARPPVMIGPTGCRSNSSDAAMPKLPPPPRIAQKRSGFSPALARHTLPSAITISADRRLSSASPYFGISQPMPPPSVRPAMPVLATTPPVVASPCSCVSRFSSFHNTPPCARTVRAAGSTWMPFIGARSIIRPASMAAFPATLWPPPRTATSRFSVRASLTESATSAVPRQHAISAGRLSTSPLWTRRASS